MNALFVVAFSLIFVPQVLFYVIHSIYYIKARKYASRISEEDYEGFVSFIIPVRKEPLEYIERAVEFISSLGLRDYEVLVVSDDERGFAEKLFERASEWRRRGINAWIIWRSFPRGFRTGALNVGLFASKGDFIYVLDVDTRFDKCLIGRAIGLLKRDPSVAYVVGRWEPLNLDARLSEAIGLTMKFLVNAIYKGRSALGLPIFPLGTGTVFNARILRDELGGWDEDRIQDDMEIGARIMGRGLGAIYVDECRVFVEVPSALKALRVQQSRWSYGAIDVFKTRWRHIALSRQPLLGKIEAMLFLLQYVPAALAFLGSALLAALAITGAKEPSGPLAYSLALSWLASESLYGFLMHRELRKSTKSSWKSLVNQGRAAAVTTALSPYIAFNTLKSLIGLREAYKRTPKGEYQYLITSARIPVEVLLGALFAISALRAYTLGSILSSLWLALISAGYLYVTIRWGRDVFYK